MALHYGGADANFAAEVHGGFNQSRQVLQNRLQKVGVKTSKLKRLVTTSEAHLTSIIAKVDHGTLEQRNWVLANTAQINAEIAQLAKIRQQLGMGPSPVPPIPVAPPPPPPPPPAPPPPVPNANVALSTVSHLLFFGGAAIALSGVSQIAKGGYAAAQGGMAFFKAGETVAKETAKAAINAGVNQMGGGALRLVAGEVVQDVAVKINGT